MRLGHIRYMEEEKTFSVVPKGSLPIREDFKYYFADFVRKGGTPPPLRTKFSPKKRLRIWGVPHPLYGHSPEKC